MDDSQDIIDEHRCEQWMKLARALKVCLKQALLDILQDPNNGGLPKDAEKVHQLLKKFREEKEPSIGDALTAEQWDLISHKCSADCQTPCLAVGKSDTRGLNVPSLVLLIENLTNLQPPKAGWAKEPEESDTSKAAFTLLAKQLRKDILNGSITSKTQEDLDKDWLKAETILKGLDYSDIDVFFYLQEAALDEIEPEQIEILVDKCLAFSLSEPEKSEEGETIKKEIDRLKELVKSYSLNEQEIDEKVKKSLTSGNKHSKNGAVIVTIEKDEAVVVEIVAPNEVDESN